MPSSAIKLKLVLHIVVALLLSSCEPAMQAKIEGGNPPVFEVWSGTGKLWTISVTEYVDDKSLKPSKRDREIWRVDADGRQSASYASKIGRITYGIVPHGYHQSVPATGPPLALLAGKSYSYFIKSENGTPARGDFKIQDGNAVVTQIQRPCSYFDRSGNEVEIPCEARKQ